MTIAKIGILGAGTMGGGIAINAAQHGIEVVLVDVNAESLAAARAAARKFYARAREKGRLSEAEAAAAEARIATAGEMTAFAGVDLVLEAVFEDFDLKARLFAEMRGALTPGTLVATNTSCLRVSDLAEHVGEPELFLGMHYFSPAQVNPLVEVVRGPKTAEAVVERVLAFCRATAKKPLLCRDNYGFAVNRFFCPYTNEASRLVDEGLGTPAQIDRVAQEDLKVAAGPFFVQNIIKPRINLHAIRNLAPLGPFYAPAALLTRLGEAGESFEIGAQPAADPAADKRIAERLMAATFLPVLESLDEEVASPADIDMGAEVALKFGRPPCKLMDELGRAEVERLVAPLCASYGHALPKSIARVGRLRD
jgi:3-hydroxyacyl-CoA dehydrogenase